MRPILEYASVVWHNCNKCENDLLEAVQKRAARIVSGAIRGTRSEVIYQELGWETLSSRRDRAKLILFHKIVNKRTPAYLYESLPPKVGERSRFPLRNQDNYCRFDGTSSTFIKSFFPSTVLLWNELDINLRKIEDPYLFKKSLRTKMPKASPLYYLGKRKLSIIHSQMRMLCSPLKAHLFDMHIIESAQCACGEPRETNIHFFFTCPLYVFIRRRLLESISILAPFTIGSILFGQETLSLNDNTKIFEAVHEYIEKSGRFV